MRGLDMVVRLRELRRIREISQRNLARLSGVGEKSISSFETGARVDSLKVAQLQAMLAVCGITEAQFFSDDFESALAAAASGAFGERVHKRAPLTLSDYGERLLDTLLVARGAGFSFRTVLDEARDILNRRQIHEMGRALRGAA